MTATSLTTRDPEDEAQAAPSAPPLPLEGHAVAAARALEATKLQAERALFLLQWTPRDEQAVFQALNAVNANWSEAWHAYVAFVQVLNCKGQA